MSTKKYLDPDGLSRVWTKITNKFAPKSIYDDSAVNFGRKANTDIGTKSVALGNDVTASGSYSLAEGSRTVASSTCGHAEGNYSITTGNYAHSEGGNTIARGNYSHAEGQQTVSSGTYSHAEGRFTIAPGVGSHAEGGIDTAITITISGAANATTYTTNDTSNLKVGGYIRYNDTIGRITNITENTSFEVASTLSEEALTNAEITIFATIAAAKCAHAEGQRTMAFGSSSHAEGLRTMANGNYTHAEGSDTVAQPKSQHVQGEFNVVDDTGSISARGTYADIIGNGTNDSNRSNAYTLDWSGNGWFAGDVYTGSTSGTNKDAGSKKLATEDYVSTNSSKKISSIQSFFGVSSSLSTQPNRWTLPAEYQELEYLQSTATELIDTGVDGADVRKIECKFATMAKGASQYITGARSANPNTILFAIDGSGSNTKFSAIYNGTSVLTSDIDRENEVVVNASLEISEAVEGKRTMTFKCNDGTYDETKTQSNISEVERTGYKVGIFGWNAGNKTAVRIYREKIYTDSGLVRDYLPCLNKTTGKYGLYDMVNNQFYTSTVNFTLYGSNTTYVPQLTDEESYLWKCDLITYTDGTTQKNLPYVIEQKDQEINTGVSDLFIDLTLEQNIPVISATANVEALENAMTNYSSGNQVPAHVILSTGESVVLGIPTLIAEGTNDKAIQFMVVFENQVQNTNELDIVIYAFAYSQSTWQFQPVDTFSPSSLLTQQQADALYASIEKYGNTNINIGRAANTTVGTRSVALGESNTASGSDAVAIGTHNVASGLFTFASGTGTEASGDCAFTAGSGTISQRRSQFVIGEHNIADSSGNSTVNRGELVEIVGNGNSQNARSNARTTDWNGNGWFKGNIKVGGTGYSDSNARILMKEPASEGTSGQVLTTDGQGGRTWTSVSGGGGTSDYTQLSNKPSINSVTLSGNKSLSDLGIAAANAVINTTDLTVTSNATNLVNVATTAGFYKVPSNCWIYSDSTSSTANRVYGQTGDIVRIEPQIEDDDGEGNISYITYFTVYGSGIYRGAMTTTDNSTYTSSIVMYESQSNKVTTITSSSTDRHYPSAKAVHDFVDDNYASKSIYGSSAVNLGRKASTTVGDNSVAIGYDATASGARSLSVGYSTTASGNNSVAVGNGTTASSYSDHAEGYHTTASGGDSHAEGHETVASAYYAHSEGVGTIAQRRSQHAQGAYNIADTAGADGTVLGTYVDIIGNGTADNARSNAYTLDWSGNAWFSGDVYTGSTSGTNKDAGSKKLATEDYVDSLVVSGAQKTILYNGKANDTAILSGNIQQLSDSIFNYDLIVVGFNCLVQNASRSMEICDCIYPNSNLITWCDTTGAGATGAHHIFNSNQAFNNCYRIIWGFTDATHIRNIVSAHVNTGTYGWVDEGICYVIGYKFSALPDGYATEQYVDDKITYGTSDLTAGTSPLTTGTLYFVYE